MGDLRVEIGRAVKKRDGAGVVLWQARVVVDVKVCLVAFVKAEVRRKGWRSENAIVVVVNGGGTQLR